MIDVYQRTAKQKNICEDYVTNNNNTIVLSDGCSSSKNTRVGAMLYGEIGLQIFSNNENAVTANGWKELASKCNDAIGNTKANTMFLDATVGMLNIREHHCIINLCGDGLLFYKYKQSDNIFFVKYDYEANTPLYPSYFLSEERMLLRHEIRKSNKLVEYTYKDGVFTEFFSTEGVVYTPYKFFTTMDMEYIGIASDGVFSFQKEGRDVPIQKIFDHITAFKGSGEFMKRKMNHMFKTLAKEGIHNSDDFSIGVWVNDN